MTVFFDIGAALNTHLKNMSGVPPIAYENKEYSPILGTAYVRPTLITGQTIQAELGATGQDVSTGVYQIDVFAKSGNGTGAATVIADNIATRFARGTKLTYNSRVVRVLSAQRQAAINSDGWYQIPVEIIYQSFTTPRV